MTVNNSGTPDRVHATVTGHEATPPPAPAGDAPADAAADPAPAPPRAPETGGPRGPEPTRYGDWERAGRCIDF